MVLLLLAAPRSLGKSRAEKDKKRPGRKIPPGLVAVRQQGTPLYLSLSDYVFCIARAK
jgi:hypothetical protein